MASSLGNEVTVSVSIVCGCNLRIPVDIKNKESKTIICSNCNNQIDLSISYYSYFHHLDKTDDLVKLGIAEPVRCKNCKEKDKCRS